MVPSSGGGRKLIRTLRPRGAVALGDGVALGDAVGDDTVGAGVAVDVGKSWAFVRLTTHKTRTSKSGRGELRLVPK
jgi:hypothetical protein